MIELLNICVHRIPQKQPNAGFATRKIRVLVIQPSNYTHPHHLYSVAIPLVGCCCCYFYVQLSTSMPIR